MAVVRSVRRGLRSVPGNGLGYGALHHLGEPGSPGAALADRRAPQVLFNYHSQVDDIVQTEGRSLYQAFHDPIGQEQDGGEQVVQLLEVVGAARDGVLAFDWYYSTNRHDEATVRAVAEDFRTALRSIARHCDPTLGEGMDG